MLSVFIFSVFYFSVYKLKKSMYPHRHHCCPLMIDTDSEDSKCFATTWINSSIQVSYKDVGTCILFHWYLISFKHDLFQFGEPLIVNLGWEKIVGKDVLSEANAPFTTVFLLPKWRVYPPDYLRGYKIGPLFLQVRTILTRLSPYAFWLLYPVLRKEFLHLHLISFL